MLAGDFTQYASAQCNTTGAVNLRGPFVGNRLPAASFSPAALKLTSHLPTTTDPCGKVTYSRSRPQDEAQYIGKVDMQLSPNHSLFGRYMLTTVKWTPPLQLQPENTLVSSQGGRDNKAHSFTVGDTMVLSNATVNALRLAVNYTDVHRTHEPLGFDAPDLGIKTYTYIEDYLLVSVNNGGFQLGGGTESEARFKTPSFNVSDDVTTIRGNHQYGFGGNVAYWTSLSQANVRSPGQFTFDGSITGLPLADFLSGRLQSLIQATPNSLDMKQWYLGFYAQDTWKLSPKTTLNYGLRWEPGLAQQIRNGAIYNFSVDRFNNNIKTTQYANAPPGFLYPGDDGFENGNAGMKNNLLQFSPRVGFAWDPAGDGRMSIRTGYSLAYDFVNAQFHLNTSVAPPFNAEARVTNPVGGFDDPWRGTGQRKLLPVHHGTELGVPIDRAVHLDPARHQAAAATVVEPERAAADRQRPRRVSDLHRHVLRSTVERAFAQPRRLRSRIVHVADRHRAAVLPGVLGQHEPRSAPPVDDGGLPGREVSGFDRRAHGVGHAEVQRNPAERSATPDQRVLCGRQLHVFEVHRSSDAGRHHAQRQLRLRGSEQYRLRLRCVRLGSPSPLQPDRECRNAAVRQ